jgi:hypothetical protein
VAPDGLDGAAVAVTLADGLVLGVGVGDSEAVGVGEVAGVGVTLGAGNGVCPEPELAGNAVRRWLVDAWIAVSAAIATTKMTTQSPPTATHRRRTVGRPVRRLLQRSRFHPEGSRGSGDGSISATGARDGRLGRVASAFDQSVRRAATATRRR